MGELNPLLQPCMVCFDSSVMKVAFLVTLGLVGLALTLVDADRRNARNRRGRVKLQDGGNSSK